MDPISGMVTTIERPRTAPPPTVIKKDEQTKLVESRSSSDLSTRLAAVMAEKTKKNTSLKIAVESTEPVVPPKDTSTIPKEEETRKEDSLAQVNQDAPTTEIQQDVPKKEAHVQEITAEAHIEEITTDKHKDVKEHTSNGIEKVVMEETDEVETKVDTVDNTYVKEVEPVIETNISSVTTAPKDDKDRILEQRETQLLQAMENIAKLHDQIHQIQEDADTKEAELRSALNQMEAKAIEDNANTSSPANLTKTIKRLETTVDDLKKQITTKEDQIQGLMHEGEKLSKVELRHSTLIKKLRLEKTESDKSSQELTKKLEKATSDLSQALEKGTKQSETEKRSQESVKLLSDLTEQQTKHINKLESEKITNTKKYAETDLALKKALESIEDERVKAKLEAEQVNAAALEKEIKANDRLHKELTKTKEDADSLETKLRKEIRELQIALQTVEEQAGLREDTLRKEISDLQTKLQQSDNKMVDISASVDEATAPLLRQIEELQTQHAVAIRNRDQAEQR